MTDHQPLTPGQARTAKARAALKAKRDRERAAELRERGWLVVSPTEMARLDQELIDQLEALIQTASERASCGGVVRG